MQKQAPTLGRLLTMVIFALSCFGLLLFLWLAFGGPIPLKPKGYQAKVSFADALGLRDGALKFEIMVETPQTLFGADGSAAMPLMVNAGAGRVSAAHFGTYDYTALCGITAAWQQMRHPACDFARHIMQVSFGGTGIWLSDGATNILPVAAHRGPLVRPAVPVSPKACRCSHVSNQNLACRC